jgi:hypothetical protein
MASLRDTRQGAPGLVEVPRRQYIAVALQVSTEASGGMVHQLIFGISTLL